MTSLSNEVPTATCGYCYVANTSGYIEELEPSLASLRVHMPDAEVAVIAPRQLWRHDLPVTHWVELPPYLPNSPIVKAAARLAPYDRVVFLDTDTYITHELDDLFQLLDRVDIAVAHEPMRGWYYSTPAPPAFCEFNTGVIVFRNSKPVNQFFLEWEKEHERMLREKHINANQPSFRTTLWENADLQMFILPSEYHLICGKADGIVWQARLLHGRGDLNRLSSLVNEQMGPRAFVNGWGVIRGYRGRRLWILEYLRLSIKFLRVLLNPNSVFEGGRPVQWQRHGKR